MPLSRARINNKNSDLTDKEKSEYRALVGQLNWMATQTRPDIAFEASYLSGIFKKATVGDLVKVNKLIDRVKYSCVQLAFPPMSKIEHCSLECYSDASFGNLEDSGSQGGMVIFLSDENGNRCPIQWYSRKIRRIVKSTLAAETTAIELASNPVIIKSSQASFFLTK